MVSIAAKLVLSPPMCIGSNKILYLEFWVGGIPDDDPWGAIAANSMLGLLSSPFSICNGDRASSQASPITQLLEEGERLTPRASPALFRSSVGGITVDGRETNQSFNSPLLQRTTSDLGAGGVEPPPSWHPEQGWNFPKQKPDVVIIP